ncbi:hypothetical protein ABI59_20385 [Acidobacteria bacterium Mor1]|nr:hypothetical protein ABI59_20385 [Acidobacteria bacterium Mor1]
MKGIRRGAIVCALLLTLGLASTPLFAEYVAYAVTEKDGEKPLPEDLLPIMQNRPTDMVRVKWGGFNGNKSLIRVLETQNDSSYGSYRAKFTGPGGTYSYNVNSQAGEVPIQGLDAIVSDILTQTNRFRVVERDSLDAIMAEQDLGNTGRVRKASSAKTGQLLGAQYGVKLVVNSYEPNVKGKKRGLGAFGRKLGALGGVKWQNAESFVSITMQMIDMNSGEILASEPVEVRLKSRAIDFGGVGWGSAGALGGFMGNYSKTPIGQAMIAAVNAGIYGLVKEVGNRPPSGKVAAVAGGQVIINLGSDTLSVDDVVTAVKRGEPITNPDTGEIIAYADESEVKLQVIKVSDSASYAKPMGGGDINQLAAGDPIETNIQATPLEFGQPWQIKKGMFKRKK